MTSIYRERFAATMAHQPVDRPPLDLGGCPQATIDDPALMTALAAHLGFTGEAPADYRYFDRRILAHYDVDFRRTGGIVPFDTGRGCRISDTETVDDYGMRYRFSGHYWERVDGPLASGTRDAVAAYQFPTIDQMRPGLLDKWAADAAHLFTQTPYVVVGEHPVFGVLELACWLCNYDTLLYMLLDDPETAHLLFSKILAFQRPVVEAYYTHLGRYLHITTSGDDFGTQQGPFMSPAMFRDLVLPAYAKALAELNRLGVHYVFRSDGNLWPLMDMIYGEAACPGYGETDRDASMTVAAVRARFPRLVIWGNVSSSLLARGTPAQVRDQAQAALAESGGHGYFQGCSNAIIQGTPVENVRALFSVR